jgi:hypothetical protein
MFTLATYTAVHVIISLIGIVSGLIVAAGLLSSKRLDQLTQVFLTTTVLTSITGFGFPVDHLLPSHVVGALSLLVLAIATGARYGRRMAGAWRWIYAVTAMIALYFNVFVLVIQLFQRVPALKAPAPTQSEPPFAAVQLAVLAAFAALTVMAAIRFKPAVTSTAPARS